MPKSLEILNLSGNKFSGIIPEEWSSMTNLKQLRLGRCGMNGTSWSARAVGHDVVTLSAHRAGPSLPTMLLTCAPLKSTLEELDLSGNKLGGTITKDIAAFTKLTAISLRAMDLSDTHLAILKQICD